MEKDNNMIALRSGYYFMIFDIDDVPFWEQLVNTNKRVSLDGVECDLYEVLNDNEEYIVKYDGYYLQKYSWAEERNGQLYSRLKGFNNKGFE